MRAMPLCPPASAADWTSTVASAGRPRGSRPGTVYACARTSTLNHCGLPVAIARVRVSRRPAATRCAAACNSPRLRPCSDTAATVAAIAINTITASISIRVKPRNGVRDIFDRGEPRQAGRRENVPDTISRETGRGESLPGTISPLLPVAVVTVDALASGLAIAAVEDDVVLAVLAGVDIAVWMAKWIVEVGGFGVRAVP